MNPMQFGIYKGMGGKNGAVQFNFQPPHFYKDKEKDFTGAKALVDGKRAEGWKDREGAIFLEITSAVDKNVYDWDKKIIMALSITDMGKVLYALVTGVEQSIMHDPGAKTETQGNIKKWLNVSSPKGTAEGCLVKVSQQSNGETRSHLVPLDGSELLALRQLIQTAISKSLGW